MEVKIVNDSSREIPEEFVNSVKNKEGYDRYQTILDEYNLKIKELDINYKEDVTTLYVADRR
jgi:predicted P-loop ATPase